MAGSLNLLEATVSATHVSDNLAATTIRWPFQVTRKFLLVFFTIKNILTPYYQKPEVRNHHISLIFIIKARNSILTRISKWLTLKNDIKRLTVNCDGGRVTKPLGGHVLGHTRVVVGVGQPGRYHNQVAFASDYEIFVRGRIYGPIILQPRYGRGRPALWGMTPHFHLTSPRYLL